MRKILAALLTMLCALSLAACGQGQSASADSSAAQAAGTVTSVTLTIGDKVLEGYLNDSAPAQSLLAQLPLTVTLNDSDNDFCGGNIAVQYTDKDVSTGYKNGDLAFWIPANNFVIFVSGEEKSAAIGDLVKLGRITSPQSMLDELQGTVDVTIAVKENKAVAAASEGVENMRIKITVGQNEMYANLENNAASRALVSKMPFTLNMSDLYNREMCYRYGAGSLPTDNLRSDGYQIGDIAYWPPMGSLVILYEQNGEHFTRQHLGHIDSGAEIFKHTGDAAVTFEAVK